MARRQTPHLPTPIDSMLKEKRVFKPSARFAKAARIGSLKKYRKMYRASLQNPDKFWGKMAEELTWVKSWKKVCVWKPPFAEWFVGGKTQCQRQLPRPPSRRAAAQQGGDHLGGRAGRGRDAHLPAAASRGLPAGQRAEEARREGGRSRDDLPADDSRGGHGHAGLRADRRAAQRGLQRLQRRGAQGTHERLRREGHHHRGRRLPPRLGPGHQDERRPGAARLPEGEERPRRPAAPKQETP